MQIRVLRRTPISFKCENNLPISSLIRSLSPQTSDQLLKRQSEYKQTYSSAYQRCRQTKSKSHAHRNRSRRGQPLSVRQKLFLENRALDLTKSQKLKQLRVEHFTVTRKITNTTYEIREHSNPYNDKTRHRNHLIEKFTKEERLSSFISNYVVISRDSKFYKRLVHSQLEQYNSGEENHSLDVTIFVITPIQTNSDIQKAVLKFHLEQTLEYNRLQVRCNLRLDVKIQALMKIGP